MFVEWLFSAAVLSIIAAAEDIGRGKQAYQITTVQIAGVSAAHFQPGLAVDGNTECRRWFSHTDNHQMAWWAVDLGDYYFIDYVRVTPREWLDGYTGNFKILVGSDRYSLRIRSTFTECASGYGDQRKWLRCSQGPVVGRHVVVQRERESDVMNLCLCEVEVQGRKACPAGKMGTQCLTDCSADKWGRHCAFSCSTGCRNTCDIVTGACQCKDGWFGDLCDRSCSDNCITSGMCEGPDGYCSCQPGFEPPTCRFVCPRGRFGPNCTIKCSNGCRSGDCNNIDGTCVCLENRYRGNCTGKCGRGCVSLPCDRDTGECTCKPGWQPPLCDKLCSAGYYGQDCRQTCSPGCNGTCFPFRGGCESCLQGWYGFLCDSRCETGCKDGSCRKSDGHCSCRPGYRGHRCDQECFSGLWGDGCANRCSENCINPNDCNTADGSCLCKPGYTGLTCNQRCSDGLYGQNCSKTCHSGCDGPCAPEDGKCTHCHTGWFGDQCHMRCSDNCKDSKCYKYSGNCDGCKIGFYGNTCQKTCSVGCQNLDCTQYDAYCSCLPGYKGHKCDQECEDGRWGSDCVHWCSSDCEGIHPCNRTNGACICKPGFTGMNCKTPCDSGTYGSGCTGTCSSHCVDSTEKCDRTDGSCSCRDGYKGKTCHAECDKGFYGKGCSQQCGCLSMSACNNVDGTCDDKKCQHGKKGLTCDIPCEEGTFGINCVGTCYCKGGHAECSHVNGTCASGQCVDGREGVACQKLRNVPTGTSALGIGLGVGASIVIVLIIALVLFVIFMRRRRTRKNPGKNNNETSHIVAFSNTTHTAELKDEPQPDNKPRPIPPEQVDTAEPVNGDVMPADVTCQDATDGLTYENMGIRVAEFPNYVRRMKGIEKGFQPEYESLPTGLSATCEVGSTVEALVKNRFKNIIAYDHSRVIIEGDNPLSQYINANFINGYGKRKNFIAAQGPVKATVADFIQMLWEQKVPLIVMVTNLKEKGKPKCYQYWPDQAITGRITHRGFTVRKLEEKTFPHYVIRHLELEKDSAKQPLAQVQYISWPDHGVPESPAAFLDFHKKAKHLYQPEVGPTVVHCSAGVGRTGTFLAVDYLLEQAKHEGYLNVASCVKRMREDRVNMVQSLDQYVFIHESVLEALHCGKTVYDASSYDASSVDKTELMKQYEILDKLKPTVSANNLEVAKTEENRHKNRSEDVLSNTKWRPLLMTDAKETNDYINAVFVHAYQKKHAYIATQSPLPATVVDLWRLVQDYECSTIIALNETGNNEVCPNYWGKEEEKIGPFIISEATETESNGYVKRQLKLKYKEEERKVMQFQVKSWTHGTLPAAATLLSLYEEVKAWQQESGDSRIVVHCLYGAAETGLYLCLCHVCDKIVREQEVDVFHAVQLIRKSQPLFITNLEQYEWLHQTAYEYISSFSMYANFK